MVVGALRFEAFSIATGSARTVLARRRRVAISAGQILKRSESAKEKEGEQKACDHDERYEQNKVNLLKWLESIEDFDRKVKKVR